MLTNRIDWEETRVLDLFTGTGSMAFEFLSRGAVAVTAVDANFRCVEFIRRTAAELGAANLQAVRSNCFVFIRQMAVGYDLIFADPPYDMDELATLPDLIFASALLNPDGMFILEHSATGRFENHPRFVMHRHYGSVNFSFFT